jgi:hypothetical protein
MIGRTLAGGSPLLPAATVAGVGAALSWMVYSARLKLSALPQDASEKLEPSGEFRHYFVALALLTLVLIPSSFAAVALKVGPNHHAVMFLIGPALYSLGDGLLPGTDYLSLYGLGLPWLFHFVVGRSGGQAVLNYVIIVIAASWLFYAHLIYLLHWLYRSWLAAVVAAFIPLILGFVYPSFGAPFFAPSSSVLRYPLLTVCAWLCGIWAVSPTRPLRLLSMAAVCGLALFLETESGIVMILAAASTMFVVYPWKARVFMPVLTFFLITLAVLAVLLAVAFGVGAFQPEFFRRLFDGIVIYGALGLNGSFANWSLRDWNWLYNLVAPGAMLATIAVVGRICGGKTADKQRLALLAFFSISGLMLLAKYANQSIAAVWQISSIGPFAVLGWWCVALVRRLDQRTGPQCNAEVPKHSYLQKLFAQPLQSAVATGIVTLAFVFVYSPSESSRNPARYGLQAWSDFPSLLKWPFVRPAGCVQMDCFPVQASASDSDLITARSQVHDQVAILSNEYDWIYLVAAQRPPLMAFLPSSQTFTRDQLAESLQRLDRADYLFVAKINGQPDIARPSLWIGVTDRLGTEFQKDGESEHLIAWKRTSR